MLRLKTKNSKLKSAAGMTLIEVVVALFVLVVAFVSVYALFQASLRFVSNAKAREAAVSLGVERMESMRAMSYASIGTVGGIPAGSLAQNETIVFDGITFNRRTLVQYVDDPADGSGAADSNGITADYKRAKVEVAWTGVAGTSTVDLISNFVPVGLENLAGGGTLAIYVFDSQAFAVPDAAVRITNSTGTSSIDVTTYSNTAGVVLFPGTPAGTGYHVVVSKSGYSTAQTYPASASNPNPNPGDLSVVAGQTTSASFAIDRLASLTVNTLQPGVDATTTVTFTDASGVAQFNNTEVSGNALRLSGSAQSGSAYMDAITPGQFGLWRMLSWDENLPTNTEVRLHLYTVEGGVYTLVPDSALPGNSTGFTTSPVSIGTIPAWDYPSLALGAELITNHTTSPKLFDWTLSYTIGSVPLPNASFGIHGTKTIGTTGTGAAIYKVDETHTTSGAGQWSSSIEWDSYNLAVAPTSGWDLSASCPPMPVAVAPAASVSVNLYLWPHTNNSLRVAVLSATSSAPLAGATVTLSRSGSTKEKQTGGCGDAFFPGLSSASNYSLTASAPGYTSTTTTGIVVSGQSTATISL